jgi:gliding motility-associated protein GldM
MKSGAIRQRQAKAQIWFPKAQRAQQLTNELNTYISGLRSQIMAAAGFDPAKNGDSTFKEDNQDVATRLMVEEGRGKELRARLEKYKADMLAIDPSLKGDVEADLRQINLEIPPSKNTSNPSWETAYFHMVPTVAAITMLSKFQNDVKTAENRVVSLFHEQVGKVAVRFDKFAAIIGQSSSYVMPGQEIEITAGVGAFSTGARPHYNKWQWCSVRRRRRRACKVCRRWRRYAQCAGNHPVYRPGRQSADHYEKH